MSTEPLEGAMLPNAPPPTWPDLAYWREVALQVQGLLADQREKMLAWQAAAEASACESAALRLELEIARKLIAEMRAPVESTRAAVAKAPFPARALRTFSAPEVWR